MRFFIRANEKDEKIEKICWSRAQVDFLRCAECRTCLCPERAMWGFGQVKGSLLLGGQQKAQLVGWAQSVDKRRQKAR